MHDPHFAARAIFNRSLSDGTRSITALRVPIADAFRGDVRAAGYPALGEGNGLLDGK